MKMLLQLHGAKYSIEKEGNDYYADELKEMFSRLLVCATFPPSVIESDDGGRYEYVEEDEVIIKKEKS